MRIKVSPIGELIIPAGQLKALGLTPGQEATVNYEEGKLVIARHVLADPFKDLHKKGPSASERLNKAFADEAQRHDKAKSAFEKMLKDPPKVEREDQRGFWD